MTDDALLDDEHIHDDELDELDDDEVAEGLDDELDDDELDDAPPEARRAVAVRPSPPERPAPARRADRPESPGRRVPLLDNRAFRGPFHKVDGRGVPLLEVFRLRRGRGGDGRACVRMVAHARVPADYDVFDLAESGAGHDFPPGRYRVQIKDRSGQILGQEDVEIGGADVEADEGSAGGVVLLGRAAPTPAAAPEPPPRPSADSEAVGRAIEHARDGHRQHVDDLRRTYDARIAEMIEAHAAQLDAVQSAADARIGDMTAAHREALKTLSAQLDAATRQADEHRRQAREGRERLHELQIDNATLKIRLELGPNARGPARLGEVVAELRSQRDGIAELRELLGAADAAEPEESAGLIERVKAQLGPLSQLLDVLGDDAA